ncbi:MAG: SDR family NAD(P)-dependent oxidoreductase [Acidobacteria bacterium]|nr:MAG: SDR family NAD(P)-dependent oxidoreductase [Acidobacteriota bacterium]REK03259.1 MAG: SDR family NAD(P)-dependent oxidoreductase [Acidobacteriota bacterium]
MADVLVLGSNRGIGLELVRQLAARGDSVTAVCRSSSERLEAISGVAVRSGVDVTDRAALEGLAADLGAEALDLLVVVAGVLERVTLDRLDVDAIRRQFEINALGPLLAVSALRRCVRGGGKIGLVTSRMGSIADNDSGGSYGYRMSKAALNMAGRSLAHDLADREIAVVLLHPGWVRTDMTGGSGLIDVDESAAGLIARLDELSMETTGTFVHQSGEPLPW